MTVSPERLRQAVLRWGARLLRCHADDCSAPRRAWERMSSRSGSIRVDGLEYCFPQCFEQDLQRRFELMRTERVIEHRPAHRVPLGLIMLSRADVTTAQLRHALAQRDSDTGVRIGERMRRLGYAGEQQVTAALALQWRCPVLHTMPQQIAHCGLPYGLLERFQMLPVHFAVLTRTLHVAFAQEITYGVLVSIEQMFDCKTEACLTTPTELQAGFERLRQNAAAPEKQFACAREPAEMARIVSSYAARLDAGNVKLAACGGLAWVRIESGDDCMNLLFRRPE